MGVPKQVQDAADAAAAREREVREGVVTPFKAPGEQEQRGPQSAPAQDNQDPAGLQPPAAPVDRGVDATRARQLEEDNARLQNLLAKATERSQALEARIGSYDERFQELEAKANAAEKDKTFSAVEEAYEGDPMLEALRQMRAENEALRNRLDDLSGQTEALVGDQRQRAESADKRLVREVKQRIRDMDKVNRDQSFIAWMNEVDPTGRMYGINDTRQEAINKLRDGVTPDNFENTVERIVAFYDTWETQKRAFRKRLGLQVTPDSAASEDDSQDSPTKVWGPRRVQEFYASLNSSSMTDAERQRTEQDIYVAREDPERWDPRL